MRARIQQLLNTERLAENLTALFCETLRWGAPRGMSARALAIGAPVSASLTAVPIAQLSGLPVLRVDWPEDRLPTVTHRRAVQRALAPVHAEHLLCYLMRDRRYVAFVWAHRRADGKTELRTLPYEVGAPARTTVERLAELAFRLDELGTTGQPPITAVTDKLNAAFSVEKVTKQFYEEIANWYFWALDHTHFPRDAPKQDGKDHVSLIRLITRVIFSWFLKEKELIPGTLFDPQRLLQILNGFAPDAACDKASVFYKAILQNLFFATLNTEMGKRAWAKNEQNFMAHSLYRHRELFRDPSAALDLFKDIPFLNGGLFECLDRIEGTKEKPRYVRIDGFSRRTDSQPVVPDFLFFGEERPVDLSEVYGKANYRSAKVRGLVHTLSSYNFTLAENTPLDQEVALDPELLGKVFENLLAAYNPETRTTARKATGSYYTPREIVDYMVDEALIASLTTEMLAALPETPDIETRLRHLFAYNDEVHRFTEPEVEALIHTIDHLKILDPACGSGAFPMGILHKLVFVLGKLDPGNARWKARQLEKAAEIPDSVVRERVLADIEQAFTANELDYGRKLYLIENCIYGVDIQPIAAQIAKLRFFISLVVDQRVNLKLDNLGIRALPNLETKFVAANTLIGLDRPKQLAFRNPKIDELERELARVREAYFIARTPATKHKHRERDAELRVEIAGLLKEDGWDSKTARVLAAWDPYDQNASALFFDAEWMFGLPTGFDVVIGNPPYVSALDFTRIYGAALREALNSRFNSATGAYDLFVVFIEQGLNLCRPYGLLCFITPNKYLAAKYAKDLRAWLLKNASLQKLFDVSAVAVFEEASVYPVISVFCSNGGSSDAVEVSLPRTRSMDRFVIDSFRTSRVPTDWLHMLPESIWGFLLSERLQLLPRVMNSAQPLSQFGQVSATSTAAEAEEFGNFFTSQQPSNGIKVINTGTIDRYAALWGKREMTHAGQRFLTPWLPAAKAPIGDRRLAIYRAPKIVFAKMAKTVEAFIDTAGEYASVNTNCFFNPRGVSLKYVGGVCNSRMFICLYDLFFGALRMSGGYYQFQAPQLRVMPIPYAGQDEQTAIAQLVDAIMDAKQRDIGADTSAWEREIDERVYRLYGLTPDEICIVEE